MGTAGARVMGMRAETAIVGMGRTGCSVARYLARMGQRFEMFDERLDAPPAGIAAPFHSGPLRPGDLDAFARVIASPGVDWRHPALVSAREAGSRVAGDLELFREQFRGELLAVTGTNGKSTVVHLLGLMLEVLPGGVEVAGNIGRPMLDLLGPDEQPARVALELSSFQLERAGPVRPAWAALLNVRPDHADMHEDFNAYCAAKLRLFAAQGEGDAAALPLDGEWDELAGELAGRGVRVRRFGRVERPEAADMGVCVGEDARRLFWRDAEGLASLEAGRLRIMGAHQHLNLAVAAQAAADQGVSRGVIVEALTAFRGLPHRLQFVARRRGRDWYDDSKATNPDAALAALAAFDRVVWICGGLTKGVDLAPLEAAARRHAAMALVIGKEPAPFVEMLARAGVPRRVAGDIETAVATAAEWNEEQAADGAPLPVVLAPAAASQDQFRDYAERGERFAAAVAALEPGLRGAA